MRKYLLCLIFCLSACANDGSADTSAAKDEMTTPPPPQKTEKTQGKYEMISLQGTLVYKQLEGGFWAFDAENGQKFMPRGLPDNAKRSGLIVKIEGHVMHDVLTFQQYGQVLKVRSLVVIDDSKVSDPNAF